MSQGISTHDITFAASGAVSQASRAIGTSQLGSRGASTSLLGPQARHVWQRCTHLANGDHSTSLPDPNDVECTCESDHVAFPLKHFHLSPRKVTVVPKIFGALRQSREDAQKPLKIAACRHKGGGSTAWFRCSSPAMPSEPLKASGKAKKLTGKTARKNDNNLAQVAQLEEQLKAEQKYLPTLLFVSLAPDSQPTGCCP